MPELGTGSALREWPSIEREAVALRSWEIVVIPGLLQTEDYARAVLRGILPDDSDEQIDEHVVARLKRQEILDRCDPPTLWVVIDETALRRPVAEGPPPPGQQHRLTWPRLRLR